MIKKYLFIYYFEVFLIKKLFFNANPMKRSTSSEKELGIDFEESVKTALRSTLSTLKGIK